jgi:Ca2+-binding EF-hand superfamily protein
LNLDELFAVLDTSGDKQISPEEFLKGLQGKSSLSDEDISDLFRAVDIDRSGALTIDELRQELKNINAAIILQ